MAGLRDVALEELRMPKPLAEAESSESGDESFAPSAALFASPARIAPAAAALRADAALPPAHDSTELAAAEVRDDSSTEDAADDDAPSILRRL